jgi:hypothetical protein
MLYPEEAERNVESILDVPLAVLPDGLARSALLVIATAGHDCYCYASGGEATGTWCVWLQALADHRKPECNGTVPLSEWQEHWRELMTEAKIGAREVRG